MSALVHETEVTYFTFPLLAVQLKEYKKQLSDAVWEENQEKIAKLKDMIRFTEIQIALGETYDIPF
jgi:hypothetical protein